MIVLVLYSIKNIIIINYNNAYYDIMIVSCIVVKRMFKPNELKNNHNNNIKLYSILIFMIVSDKQINNK